jgi:hypothetical protein
MQPNSVTIRNPEIETFRAPARAQLTAREGEAMAINVSSIVSLAFNTFTFQGNSNTPGRFLEQSVVVNVPSGAGFFTCAPHITGAFTTGDFRFLTERPLGQFYVDVGLRGNNLVCGVRLTDSNSDDPIFIQVTAIVVFYN